MSGSMGCARASSFLGGRPTTVPNSLVGTAYMSSMLPMALRYVRPLSSQMFSIQPSRATIKTPILSLPGSKYRLPAWSTIHTWPSASVETTSLLPPLVTRYSRPVVGSTLSLPFAMPGNAKPFSKMTLDRPIAAAPARPPSSIRRRPPPSISDSSGPGGGGGGGGGGKLRVGGASGAGARSDSQLRSRRPDARHLSRRPAARTRPRGAVPTTGAAAACTSPPPISATIGMVSHGAATPPASQPWTDGALATPELREGPRRSLGSLEQAVTRRALPPGPREYPPINMGGQGKAGSRRHRDGEMRKLVL
mmetsp:Transcript_15942/g.40506  ORF Transcript_15942/g.40506 Transcript_15942/m.40506 type:complete len:307 (-) Transcript_15942:18-938(-)